MTEKQRLLLEWVVKYDKNNTIGVTTCGKYILLDGEFLKQELERVYHMGAIYYTAFRLKKRFSWAKMNRMKVKSDNRIIEVMPF